MSGVRATVILCLAFIGAVLAMFVVSMTRDVTPTVEELAERGVVLLPAPRELAPFELTASDGSSFTAQDFEGQWNFVFFGFTKCPDICPVTMSVARTGRATAGRGSGTLSWCARLGGSGSR